MTEVSNHQSFLDVAASRDRASFQARLISFAANLGFPLMSATLVVDQPAASPLFITLSNTPPGYADASVNLEDSLADPVLKRLKHLSIPFMYDQSMYVHDGVGHLWEQQAMYGYSTGIALAAHMPRGRHFLLGLDREEPLYESKPDFMAMLANINLLSAFAQETAVRLLLPALEIQPIPHLTHRELEVLRWARDGKTTDVIADILSLSVSTVNFHFRAAEAKLGVTGKNQAVVKAMSLKLL